MNLSLPTFMNVPGSEVGEDGSELEEKDDPGALARHRHDLVRPWLGRGVGNQRSHAGSGVVVQVMLVWKTF